MAGWSASTISGAKPRSCRAPSCLFSLCWWDCAWPSPRVTERRCARVSALALGEALRFPNLELESLSDEDGGVGDAGIVAELVRQDDAAVRIDLEDAALAVEGGRQALVVLGEGLEDSEPLGDGLLSRTPPPSIAGRSSAG